MSIQIKGVGIIGVGTMGIGIAQIAIQSGHEVLLYDVKSGAAEQAKEQLTQTLNRLADKGKFSHEKAMADLAHLHIAQELEDLKRCDLVVEAIVENLQIKQQLVKQLEQVLDIDTIIASNTSSLSITAIAAGCLHPERIAGYHFFNPVALMKVVEVIEGFHTRADIIDALMQLSIKMGHHPVKAKDTPGFIINHAGRAFGTEAYAILGENVTTFAEIDRILREGVGFKMGPFELGDLTGLDVSHPVSESIYHQYYEDTRYRPSVISRQRFVAQQLGRKTGHGFYDYSGGVKQGDMPPAPMGRLEKYPKVWLATDIKADRELLENYLKQFKIDIDTATQPSSQSLILIASYGEDASTSVQRYKVNPVQVVCIDLICGLERHRTLMPTLKTDAKFIQVAQSIFNLDGTSLSVITESVGFVAQRVLAMIVNLGCEIAQQNVASVEDINTAVKLGLGYPYGPIEWGDVVGKEKILCILERMNSITADPRYRPSAWLRRRVQLQLPLVFY